MGQDFWTDERVARLRQAASDKCSAAQIAIRVGDGCSRSAVIGYASRHKIALNPPQHVTDEMKLVRRMMRIEKLVKWLTDFDARSRSLESTRAAKRLPMANELAALRHEIAALSQRLVA